MMVGFVDEGFRRGPSAGHDYIDGRMRFMSGILNRFDSVFQHWFDKEIFDEQRTSKTLSVIGQNLSW